MDRERFVTGAEPADVAVVVVTYNSADDVDDLIESLRIEAADLRLRVVVADNASSDGTLETVRRHADVVAVATGGNLGYAGGINVAMENVGEADAILILNPDLRVEPGAIRSLRDAARTCPDAGIVVPRIVDDEGRVRTSIFREPTLVRALADAVLGPVWPGRPSALSEWERRPDAYTARHEVDWATGAALLIPSGVARLVGEWDERFFLYSEETDYCRRVRGLGFRVVFEPSATVSHREGGSGASTDLDVLLNVNRVRYMRKHAPRAAGAYRAIVLLGAWLRRRRSHAAARTAAVVARQRRWDDLPSASWHGSAPAKAAVVVPAHDEATVIERTLTCLAEPLRTGAIDVHVVCNGCSDDTAARARAFPRVEVSELSRPSKVAAINHGILSAGTLPVIVLDADIDLPSAAIPGLVRALGAGNTLAGRPPFRYDVTASSPLVRAYYRARLRIPEMSNALWGAGIYALNPRGVEAVGELPDVTADDFYVDQIISSGAKAFPAIPPVRVRMPRTSRALIATLIRVHRGTSEQGVDDGPRTLWSLLRTIRGPISLTDAIVFCAIACIARMRTLRPSQEPTWIRDYSTR